MLAGGVLTGCTHPGPSPQQVAATVFLTAVGRGDSAAAAALTTDPGTAGPQLSADLTGLGAGAVGTLRVTGVHTSGTSATADFTAAWAVRGGRSPWPYSGHLPLVKTAGMWHVQWSAPAVFPGLAAGESLGLRRVQPVRAALNSSDGHPIFTATPVVHVGIEPKLVTNLPALARTLAAVPQLQITAAQVVAAVQAAARPTDFVPVITLRRPEYELIRSQIHDLDGTVFTDDTEVLPPSAHFGEPLLGTVGPATAQLIAASQGRLVAGDTTGIGGLQQALDGQLAGTPALQIVADGSTGAAARVLATVTAAVPGQPVTLTMDQRTQTAAESALAGLSQAATVVAVQRSTGRILADANSPAATYDLGLAGAFPAGSTFKIATWTAAFTTTPALTPDSTVACPSTVTVDGRQFENENGFSYPPIPISSAFGYSCNTSAIAEAMSLPSDALSAAATALGLGATWDLPVTSFSGRLPAPAGATERAADAIGQGRVQVSPLLMALMAGAATSGTPVRPSLIAGSSVHRGAPLPATVVAKMTALMRATVALPGGTGHGLADLPNVMGKTGTAEYGTAVPPRSHAWFAGVQGDVAFAVFVYDGASAGVSPVAVAHAFLTGIA